MRFFWPKVQGYVPRQLKVAIRVESVYRPLSDFFLFLLELIFLRFLLMVNF